jgi:filamentous hemagglutinin
MSLSGNVVSALVSAANITTTANITGGYILGNGALLTGVSTSSSNINSGTSNVTVVSSGGNVAVGIGGTANVAVYATTGEYVTGLISASGNVTGGNLLTGGTISATGAISTAGNVTGGNILGGANVNSTLFTGTTVSVSGNVTGGNLNAAGLSLSGNVISALNMVTAITTTGNITGGNISATGNINIAGQLAATVADATALAIALG